MFVFCRSFLEELKACVTTDDIEGIVCLTAVTHIILVINKGWLNSFYAVWAVAASPSLRTVRNMRHLSSSVLHRPLPCHFSAWLPLLDELHQPGTHWPELLNAPPSPFRTGPITCPSCASELNFRAFVIYYLCLKV